MSENTSLMSDYAGEKYREQIERIEENERRLDLLQQVISELSAALDAYARVQEDFLELFDYYSSPQWLADYDDSSAGRLPHELKCGVLSQDAVYELITLRQDAFNRMKMLLEENEQ